MGEILVPDIEHLAADRDDGLGEHRRGELEAAMKVLGVTDHRFLGGFGRYRDSGMKWADDGHATAADETDERAFANADLEEAANLLVEVIREVRPQVLVTYDQKGGYGHPDHVQAHRVATYAVALAAVPSYRRDLGEPWDVAKVYWGAMSEGRMRAGLRALRDAGDTTTFEGMDPEGPLPWTTPDEDLGRRSRRDNPRHAEARRDAGAREPDHRRRPLLRPVQQRRRHRVGHRVLPARQGDARPRRRRRARERPLRRSVRAASALLTLVGGAAAGVAAVAVHATAWGWPLAIAAVLAVAFALPPVWWGRPALLRRVGGHRLRALGTPARR